MNAHSHWRFVVLWTSTVGSSSQKTDNTTLRFENDHVFPPQARRGYTGFQAGVCIQSGVHRKRVYEVERGGKWSLKENQLFYFLKGQTRITMAHYYCLQMIVASMQVPTLDEITKKEQSIKEALNYKFNDKDIEDVSLILHMLIDSSGLTHHPVQLKTLFSVFALPRLSKRRTGSGKLHLIMPWRKHSYSKTR